MVVFLGAFAFESVCSPFPWQCYVEQQVSFAMDRSARLLPDTVVLPPGAALGAV